MLDEIRYDEGLGTVYERIMLNEMFDKIVTDFGVRSVLEIPVRGMTGLNGINSIQFARRGCSVTLADTVENLIGIVPLWQQLNLPIGIVQVRNFDKEIMLASSSFDLVWNFAALWHLEKAPTLVHEMLRMSNNLVLIFVQNTHQPGFLLRKYLIDRKLFSTIHEQWLDVDVYEMILKANRFIVLSRGYIDIPPFPDVAIPIGRKINSDWKWNVMDYYAGKDAELPTRISKYRKLEDSRVPEQFKGLWAHHRFILAQRIKQ